MIATIAAGKKIRGEVRSPSVSCRRLRALTAQCPPRPVVAGTWAHEDAPWRPVSSSSGGGRNAIGAAGQPHSEQPRWRQSPRRSWHAWDMSETSDAVNRIAANVVRLARTPGRLLLEGRSEEHTSELQSRGHLVCRLLLE